MDLGLEIQKTNVEIRIITLEILCQFSGKTNNFDFFFLSYYKLTKQGTQCPKLPQCKQSGKNKIINVIILTFLAKTCPKVDLRQEIHKTNVNKNHQSQDIMSANIQAKRTTLTFLAQTCPKMDLGLGTQKTHVGIRIITLEILCVLIFRQNGQL